SRHAQVRGGFLFARQDRQLYVSAAAARTFAPFVCTLLRGKFLGPSRRSTFLRNEQRLTTKDTKNLLHRTDNLLRNPVGAARRPYLSLSARARYHLLCGGLHNF